MDQRYLPPLLLVLFLQACGSAPKQTGQAVVPELNINLPNADCACQSSDVSDFTFLEKGFTALHQGGYLESLQYFQRYQRMEKTPIANMEARIAIAYLSILPESPIFDSEAARDSYRDIRRDLRPDWTLHERVQLLQDSLESFLNMQAQLTETEQDNAMLRAELARKEQAIKRLRDLTLGREPE